MHNDFLTISPTGALGTTIIFKKITVNKANRVRAHKHSITSSLTGHSHIKITEAFFHFQLRKIKNVKCVQFYTRY